MMMMAMMTIITKIIEMHNRPGIGESASWDGRVCTRWFQGGIYIIESFCIDETNINDIMDMQHICWPPWYHHHHPPNSLSVRFWHNSWYWGRVKRDVDANSAKPSVSPDSGWNVVIINRECTLCLVMRSYVQGVPEKITLLKFLDKKSIS